MEVVVEYDYTAEENDELTIKKGDIIKDVSQFEEGWYIGCLNGRIGVFPDNFVKVKSSVQPKVPPVIVGELSKEADDNDANNISSSDYENNNNISNLSPNSATKQKPVCGIGLGNIFSGQPIQLKQTALKEVVKENELLSERTSGNVKIPDDTPPNYSANHVRTRYDYTPKHSDELELRIDDIIQVLDRNLPDDGWWKGKNLRTNSVGIFPDNFVAPMNGANKELDENKLQYSTNASSLPNKSVSMKTITLQNSNGNAIEAKSPRNTNSTMNNGITPNPVQSTTTFDVNRLTKNKSTSHVSTTKTSVTSSPGVTTYQPNNFSNTLSSGGSLGVSLTRSNSIGNSLNNNQPNFTTSSPGLVQGGKNSAVNSKWRSTDKQDSNELSKVHNGGDGDAKSMDNSNVQRLIGYTNERPRQTGRRLPTKLSNATNPVPDLTHTLNTPIRSTIAASKSNDIHVHDTSVNKKNITCVSENLENNNSASSFDQIGKSNESVYNQHGRTINPILNQSRTGK
ncbi:SH3 domain-containing kinase-binding protein isoform 2 [Schistosoma japonicum]|uniref:SH3 domain-containing kinase-binding protein isoform 2 n=1 Tax=Schistosoma japonicum TaxID=6182 RepID=A0A4Z2D5G7_SCHJA|nr:SH3 domain-containing kinase-binding protein isoform 2 [Schistosoma japonicum]